MALTFTSGSTNSVVDTETDLFGVVISDNYHACLVFLQNMAVGDVMVFRVYVRDANGATVRIWDTVTKSGLQPVDGVALYFAPIATQSYRITVTQTLGTARAITWNRSVS